MVFPSFGVLLQRLSLHFLFFWWTHPRGVEATFQGKSVPFASASFSLQDRLQPFLSAFFSVSAVTNPHPNPVPWGRLNTNISQSLTPSGMRFLSNPLLFPTNPHLFPGWGFTLTSALTILIIRPDHVSWHFHCFLLRDRTILQCFLQIY